MAVTLLIRSGKRAGTRLALPSQKLVVGRGEDCDIRFNSEAVSRHHCYLHVTENTLEVEDLNSQNGTLVNDEPVQGRVALKSNDLLVIGNMQFQVLLQPAKAAKGGKTTDDDIANWLQHEPKSAVNEDTAVLPTLGGLSASTGQVVPAPAEPEPVKPHNPLVDRAADAIRRYHRDQK